jgi:folate-binding protein YgfZ
VSNPAYRAARSWAARRSSPDVRHALVTGADRAGWLQGLVTNDVLALRPGQGCYAAFLTPQGRMLADVHLLHLDSAFLLALPAAAEALIGRLERFIVMEDVAVADVSGRVACLSVHGPAAASAVAAALSLGERPRDALAALPEDHAVLVQDGSLVDIAQAAGALGSVAALVVATRECGVPGFLLCTSAAHATRLDAALAEANVPGLTGEEWTALRIEAGRPMFGADLTTDTIPLEAGLEDRAISFTKGCYVGQEVIVRVRDRGHGRVARHLVGLVAQDGARAAVAIDAGDTIRRGDRDTGRVTSAAWSPALGTWIALGYLGRDDAEPGTCVVIVREDGEVAAEVRALPLVRPQGDARSPRP